jgi:Fe-S-cluster containining protein
MSNVDIVACGACRACCRGDAIVLHPEHGDDPTQYETVPMPEADQKSLDRNLGIRRNRVLMLKHGADGNCIYLDEKTGCTIYDRRPLICRQFNCAKMVEALGLDGLRNAMAKGLLSKDVVQAGLTRMPRSARRRLERDFSKVRAAS